MRLPNVGPPSARGITLIELLVVLAILSFVLGVSGLALASLRLPQAGARAAGLRSARGRAIAGGIMVRVVETATSLLPDSGDTVTLFLPDGRAIGPGVDPLTGAPVHAPR